MRPAERILRYPNLASYLEENLPIRKTILLQCPLAKHWKLEETIRIQHYFICNMYSKIFHIIGNPYKNLNLNSNLLKNKMFSLPQNQLIFYEYSGMRSIGSLRHIWNEIGTAFDKLLSIS